MVLTFDSGDDWAIYPDDQIGCEIIKDVDVDVEIKSKGNSNTG